MTRYLRHDEHTIIPGLPGTRALSAPKIQSLPPTTEAFVENVKRSHLQTWIWKAAPVLDPPVVDPVEYGYVRHEPSKSLLRTTVPYVTLAPDEIMSLIKCNCDGTTACRNMRCSCIILPCTLYHIAVHSVFHHHLLEMNVSTN